jgi:4-hydroxythreonine-4-phosphate dehydrogenase
MTGIAREQASRVGAMRSVETLEVEAAALLSGAWAQEERQLERALESGRDVLVLPLCNATLTYEQGQDLAQALARFVAGCADVVGGLVATGGETARAVLDAWGVTRLRIRGEIEPGVAFSTTEDWRRIVPVMTKAGGFGDADTLVRCGEVMRGLRRSVAKPSQAEVR